MWMMEGKSICSSFDLSAKRVDTRLLILLLVVEDG